MHIILQKSKYLIYESEWNGENRVTVLLSQLFLLPQEVMAHDVSSATSFTGLFLLLSETDMECQVTVDSGLQAGIDDVLIGDSSLLINLNMWGSHFERLTRVHTRRAATILETNYFLC